MTVKARIRHRGAGIALTALLALVAVPQFAFAEDPAPDTVVARVDGAEITEADLSQAALNFGDQIAQLPADQRHGKLIELLIDTKLSAQAAEAAGLDKNPDVQRRLLMVHDRVLQVEYLNLKVLATLTDEALHKRFDELVKSFVPEDQYQAAHILVKTEDEAKAIIAELDKGGDFAAIAKEKSIDTGSGPNGGELGFFSPKQMVKPFGDAVVAMKVGTYSEKPVQTQFGWHVIKLEATRKQPAPTYDQVEKQLRQQMLSERFAATMKDLRAKAKIEIIQSAPPAPAPTPPAAPAK